MELTDDIPTDVKFDENSLPCRMDRRIKRAICFNKDDSEMGEDEDDYQCDIFRHSAGAINNRIRATDASDAYPDEYDDPDDQNTFDNGDDPDDVTDDTK